MKRLLTFAVLVLVTVMSSWLHAQEPPTVEQRIETLHQERAQATEEAKQAFLTDFSQALEKLKAKKFMRIETQLRSIETLQKERDQFAANSTLPDSMSMRTHKLAYLRLVKTANEGFAESAKRMAKGYLDAGDVESAATALAASEKSSSEKEKDLPVAAIDPLVGSKWDFLGRKKIRINGMMFEAGGKMKVEQKYDKASWTRLDETTILFNYSPGDSYIVLHIAADKNFMKGFHSTGGNLRYLRRVKSKEK